MVKNPPAKVGATGDMGRSIPWRRKWQPILAGIIPWTEEPGGPQSLGSQSRTPLSD